MRMLSSVYENFDEKLYDVNKHISVKLYNYIFSKVELILFFLQTESSLKGNCQSGNISVQIKF